MMFSERDAETVEALHGARGSVLVERALGHLGEDERHRVGPVLLVHVGVVHHPRSVRGELIAEEHVGEVHLADDVDEVEHLAEEEADGVEVVVVQVHLEVVDQQLLAVPLGVLVDDRAVHLHHQHLALAALPDLPQVARHEEQDRLEEEHKAHPLVVLVILDLVAVLDGVDARVRHRLALRLGQRARHGERRVDPAVGVHYIARNAIDDAVDRVADVLPRGDQQRADDQQDHRRLVVQAEDVVVDADRVDLQQALHRAKNIKHLGGCERGRPRLAE